MSIDLIPDEIIVGILSNLNLKDLHISGRVSKRLNEISNEVLRSKMKTINWRLDIFYPDNEEPEGVMLLEQGDFRKRKRLDSHEHQKHRKYQIIGNGLRKSIWEKFPTFEIGSSFWKKAITVDVF